MEFGQLIECNMRHIFRKKSDIEWSGATSPRSFSKKLKFSLSLDQYSKVLYSLLLFYDKLRAIEIYRN